MSRVLLFALLLVAAAWPTEPAAQPVYRPPARPIPPRDQRPGSVLRRELTRQGVQLLPGIPARPQDAWRPNRPNARAESIAPPGWQPPSPLAKGVPAVRRLERDLAQLEKGNPPNPRPTPLSQATGAAGKALVRACVGTGCVSTKPIEIQTAERPGGKVARAEATCPSCGGFSGATAQRRRTGAIGVEYSAESLAAAGKIAGGYRGPQLTPSARVWGGKAAQKIREKPAAGVVRIDRKVFGK